MQRFQRVIYSSTLTTDGDTKERLFFRTISCNLFVCDAMIVIYFSFSCQPPSKSITWKKKSKENTDNGPVPSATFRMRQGVHPLSRIHRTPTVVLNESRASMTSLLASSLESLAMEKKLIEESSEKTLLGKLYDDKEYLQFLAAAEGMNCRYLHAG